MLLPECYDPVFQAERREQEWDTNVARLTKCKICGDVIYPGNRYHETRKCCICSFCMEALSENECVMEEP